MMLRKLFLLIFILLVNLQVRAQKTVINQSLYWVRYYNQLSVNEKMAWHNEIDNRRFFENNRQQQLIVHSRFHYKISNSFEAALGLTYSSQNPQDPNSDSGLAINEFRPVQEFNYNISFNPGFNLQQRLRLDERFIHRNDGLSLLEGYDFHIRFRYRIQMSYRLKEIEEKVPHSLKISDELMINSGTRFAGKRFDQNRIYAGLELGLITDLSAELGYLHIFQQRANTGQYFERDIIRLTLFHKIHI